MINITKNDINSLESESGVIASLIHNPEFVYYSEELLPTHFTNKDNRLIYTAICDLVGKGITTIDPYNILEDLNSSDSTRNYAENLSVEQLQEFIDISDAIARHSIEEYKMLVLNIINSAFRRQMYDTLKSCENMCLNGNMDTIEEDIYEAIDGVALEYATRNEIPQYKDMIDKCWEEIQSRQKDGFAGIPFKFPRLNDYATIEPGELFVFAASAKEGKSMMLLNCAIDLLKKGYSVLYVDSELNTRLFTARVIAHLSGIEYKRLIAGRYSKEEEQLINEAIKFMKKQKFTHIYIPMFDQQSIYTAVKKVKHTQGLDVLIIDYFKGSGEGDAFNSYQELGRFVDTVKNKICGDMGICGIGAVQATADGKVADSAKIGRNASTIALITNKTPKEIDTDGVECGNKKLQVILNRNGMQMAPGEYIDLRFDGNHILYEEAKQHIPESPY